MKYKVTKKDFKGLNSIVQRYNFSNYKEAGVKSVPSGNFDLIRPGDEIEFKDPIKGAPSGVASIGTTNLSLKNEKLQNDFEESKKTGTLKEIKNPLSDLTKAKPEVDIDKNGNVNIKGDENTNKLNEWEGKKMQEEKEWFDKQLSDYDDLFKSMTSNISTEKQSAIDRISNVFKQRLETQKRINKFNLDRVKAYGLRGGGGNALYTPLMFSDVITAKEQENADKLNKINVEMENSISEIERAFNEKNYKLAKEKLDTHYKLKERLNKSIDDIEKQSNYHLKKLRETEKNWKLQMQEERKKALTRIKGYVSTKDLSGMSNDKKLQLAENLANKYGLDTYEVLGMLQSISNKKELDNAKTELTKEKVQTEKARRSQIWTNIKNIKNQIFNRNKKLKNDAKLNNSKIKLNDSKINKNNSTKNSGVKLDDTELETTGNIEEDKQAFARVIKNNILQGEVGTIFSVNGKRMQIIKKPKGNITLDDDLGQYFKLLK